MNKHYLATSIGRRPYMEDTHCMERLFKGVDLYGVFDGHNGDTIAQLCRHNYPDILKQTLFCKKDDIAIAIRESFKCMDQVAILSKNDMIGSTISICLMCPDRVYFANAGDSMSMIGYKDGTSILASYEHKVENEKERILSEGGAVTYYDGVARVNGTLNVARGIGDAYIKKHVNSIPFIRTFSRKQLDDASYILIASDGLWDTHDANEIHRDVIKFSEPYIQRGLPKAQYIPNVINQLIISSQERGSTDNVTILYIDLE